MNKLTPIFLDVSLLAPPEPMQAIVTHLPMLSKNHYLEIKHSRKPIPLLALLDEQGINWHYQTIEHKHGHEHWLWVWLASCEFTPPSNTH